MNKSKHLALVAGLIFYSLASHAQSIVKAAENSEAAFYVRPESIKRSGTSVDFWQIMDFKQPKLNRQGETYRSMEVHIIIDCTTNTQRLVYVRVYSSNMLSGKSIASGPLNRRDLIPSGTALETVRNFVCR